MIIHIDNKGENVMNRRFKYFILILSLLFISTGCSPKEEVLKEEVLKEKQEIKTTYMGAVYGLDISDKKQMVGDADYVFLGKVLKEQETIYLDVPVVKDELGRETSVQEYGSPYTYYDIEVLQPIKGEMEVNETVRILKAGGIRDNEYFIYEDDILLEEDKSYILLAYVQPDGSLRVVGANSSIEVKNRSIEEGVLRSNKDILLEYEDAYENEILSERKRFEVDENTIGIK
jgi:hypothetical protein